MKRSLFRYGSTLLLAGLIGGCAISVENLIPPSSPASTPKFDKTIKIHNVTGAIEPYFGGPALVSNEDYTAALVETLKQSKLFQQVFTDKPGDYELMTTILAHGTDQALAGEGFKLDSKNAMVVEYRIVDAQSKSTLWKKGFNSRHEVTVWEAFSGAARTIKSQEGSARKNLKQFITSLASAKLE